jgi:hypothetical protein
VAHGMGEVWVGWLVGGWGQIRVAALKLDEYVTVCDACNPGRKQRLVSR